jgi:hypothetical protein
MLFPICPGDRCRDISKESGIRPQSIAITRFNYSIIAGSQSTLLNLIERGLVVVYVLTPQEEADLDASIAAEERGDFATDEEMLAIWAKYAR